MDEEARNTVAELIQLLDDDVPAAQEEAPLAEAQQDIVPELEVDEEVPLNEPVVAPRRRPNRRVVHRVAKSLSQLAKAEFGALTPNAVNESVVRAFCLREAKNRKIPPKHLCAMLTWAVHFYWIPTQDELAALRDTCTVGYNNRVDEYKKNNYIKRVGFLPAWVPFNRRNAFKVAPKSA